MVNKCWSALLDGLFPHHCCLCDQPSDNPLPLCTPCRCELCPNVHACSRCALPLPATGGERLCGQCQRRPPPFSRVLAPWIYDERLAHLVTQWKFQRQWHLTPLLANLWLQEARPSRADITVPVPLHWGRLLRRGVNQSQLLLEGLRRQHQGTPLPPAQTRLVRRHRRTAAQSGMNAHQRAHNLQRAFTVRKPCDNLRIAIVDDVLTTGATACSLAQALRQAGASEVEVWCLARTPAPDT